MAKKMSKKSGRTTRSEYADLPSMSSGRRRSGSASVADENHYMSIVRELISNPAVKYVAGGIATALLTRLATKLNDSYPEISNFIRENIDTIEGKFGDYRSNGPNAAH